MNFYHLILIPRESLENLIGLKFILEFKLHQQYSEIMKTPYIEAKKIVKALVNYYEEKNKNMEQSMKGLKKPSAKR